MTHLYYFAYGSNLHPQRLVRRVPSATVIDTCAIQGYQLVFNVDHPDGSGKCNIVKHDSNEHCVHGVIYQLLAEEKILLDACETNYSDAEIRLECKLGVINAFTYLAHEHVLDDSVIPYEWYRDLVLHGARHHAFPADYVDKLVSHATQPDKDNERAETHARIIQSMLEEINR